MRRDSRKQYLIVIDVDLQTSLYQRHQRRWCAGSILRHVRRRRPRSERQRGKRGKGDNNRNNRTPETSGCVRYSSTVRTSVHPLVRTGRQPLDLGRWRFSIEPAAPAPYTCNCRNGDVLIYGRDAILSISRASRSVAAGHVEGERRVYRTGHAHRGGAEWTRIMARGAMRISHPSRRGNTQAEPVCDGRAVDR